MSRKPTDHRELSAQRWEILHQLEDWLETPMVVLGFVWLLLLILEFVIGLSRPMELASTAIWVLFILDFLIRFTLAPDKLRYLRGNWITAIALALPAVRVLRAVRIVRAARGLRLARILTSLNRGMHALSRSMGRRGLGYVVTLTALVALAGAAGMLAFERSSGEAGLRSYPEALWWTAMLLTTIGSEFWPRTAEGRFLTLVLSVYGLGVLGYITAALASFFLGRDAASEEGEIAGDALLRSVRSELEALRADVRALAVAREPEGPDRPRADEAP